MMSLTPPSPKGRRWPRAVVEEGSGFAMSRPGAPDSLICAMSGVLFPTLPSMPPEAVATTPEMA
jgi:hypothetical protein